MTLLLPLAIAVLGASNPVSLTVSKLQKSLNSVRTLEANFFQVYKSKRFDEKSASGKVWISKPGKMRWNYEDPKGRVFVIDGSKITLYDPEDRQAVSYPQGSEDTVPLALSFLTGTGHVMRDFTTEVLKDDSRQAKFKLIPKREMPNVNQIELTVTKGKPWLVTGVKVTDPLGGELSWLFTDISVNRKISPKRFDYSPPKGTPWVDMGSKE